MCASQHNGVGPVHVKAGKKLFQIKLRAGHVLLFNQLHQAGARHLDRALSVLFHQPHKFFLLKRQRCGQHQNAAVFAQLSGWLQGGLHSDHRNGQLPPQGCGSGAGSRVAGDHQGFDSLSHQMIHRFVHQPEHFRHGFRTVRSIRRIAVIKEAFLGQLAHQGIQGADSADTAVNHTDGIVFCFIHGYSSAFREYFSGSAILSDSCLPVNRRLTRCAADSLS